MSVVAQDQSLHPCFCCLPAQEAVGVAATVTCHAPQLAHNPAGAAGLVKAKMLDS